MCFEVGYRGGPMTGFAERLPSLRFFRRDKPLDRSLSILELVIRNYGCGCNGNGGEGRLVFGSVVKTRSRGLPTLMI